MTAPHIASFANLKGGTGKTTCTLNVAHEAATRGLRVLVIDLDGQCNASQYLTGQDHEDWFKLTIADVLDPVIPAIERPGLDDVIVPTRRDGIHLAPAGRIGDMTNVNAALESASLREIRLTKALRHVADNYDLVLIDCPPAINVVTLNAHAAATAGIVVVTAPDEGSYRGVLEIIDEIDLANDPEDGIGELLTKPIDLAGIVINKYDGRIKRHTEYVQRHHRLAEQNDTTILGNPIPQLTFIPDAAVVGRGMDQLTDPRATFVRDQLATILDTITKD